MIGDSFLMDQNSKMRIAGQLREVGEPQTTFLFLNSGDLPDNTQAQKRLLGVQRRVLSHDVPYLDTFSVKSFLAKRCMYTHVRILRHAKYEL